jgi:hypothetical protein
MGKDKRGKDKRMSQNKIGNKRGKGGEKKKR